MNVDRQQLLRMRDLTSLLGIARSTIYGLIAAGRFPAPLRLTGRARGWRLTEIEKWIDERQSR